MMGKCKRYFHVDFAHGLKLPHVYRQYWYADQLISNQITDLLNALIKCMVELMNFCILKILM